MPELTKLSELLQGVDAAEHYSIYRAFKTAIKAGELLAVPTVGTVELKRRKGDPLNVPEYLVGGNAKSWLSQTQQHRLKPKGRATKHVITLEDVESGRVSFEEAAAAYHASLQPKPKRRRKSKDQSDKASHKSPN